MAQLIIPHQLALAQTATAAASDGQKLRKQLPTNYSLNCQNALTTCNNTHSYRLQNIGNDQAVFCRMFQMKTLVTVIIKKMV